MPPLDFDNIKLVLVALAIIVLTWSGCVSLTGCQAPDSVRDEHMFIAGMTFMAAIDNANPERSAVDEIVQANHALALNGKDIDISGVYLEQMVAKLKAAGFNPNASLR